MERFFALMLFTLVPALALFLVLYALTSSFVLALLCGFGLFGLGLDVCLRGK